MAKFTQRNSKSTLIKEITRLQIKIDRIYDAGYWGILHVGAANYQDREDEAIKGLENVYYDED